MLTANKSSGRKGGPARFACQTCSKFSQSKQSRCKGPMVDPIIGRDLSPDQFPRIESRLRPGPKSAPNVIDNGSGMSFADVKNYWMRIATTHKQDRPISQRYGRPRTGSKGIGRFSCRRLGTRLKLVTTTSQNGSGLEQTEVSF